MTEASDRRPRRVPLDVRALGGPADIFRINRTSKPDPAVSAWLNDGANELRPVAKRWFLAMRACGEDVREAMHDGCPVACIGDAPFAYVNSFKNHVNVGFFRGSQLRDPHRLLEGTGKMMRHVKVMPDQPPNEAALGELITAAYLELKSLEGERARNIRRRD